jgi:hypothetical protein
LLVDESLDVGWKRVVLRNEIREFIDGDHEIVGVELFSEVVERLVPAVDPRYALVEVSRDSVDELLALSILVLLGRKEVHVRPVSAEFLEQLYLADSPASVDDEYLRSGRLERGEERIQLFNSVVESRTLNNHYWILIYKYRQ